MNTLSRRQVLRSVSGAALAAVPGVALAASTSVNQTVSVLRAAFKDVAARWDHWSGVQDAKRIEWFNNKPPVPRELWVPTKWSMASRHGNLFEKGWKGGPWRILTADAARIILETPRLAQEPTWDPGDPEDERWDTDWTAIWDWTHENQPIAVALEAAQNEWRQQCGIDERNLELDAIGTEQARIEAEIMNLPADMPGAFLLKVQVLANWQRDQLILDEPAPGEFSRDEMMGRIFDDADRLVGGAA